MDGSTIQSAINEQINAAIERFDFSMALRFCWMSHANDNATFEPDDVAVYLQKLKVSDDNNFPLIGK